MLRAVNHVVLVYMQLEGLHLVLPATEDITVKWHQFATVPYNMMVK